jgi:hypothetical protein
MSHELDAKDNKRRDAASRSAEKSVQRSFRNHNRGSAEPAEWGDVDSVLLRDAVTAIARNGGALQCGYTRDKGAFALRILGDGEPYTEYVRPNEDIGLWLREFANFWNGVYDNGPLSEEG